MKHFPKLETDAPMDGSRYVRQDGEWVVGAGNTIAGTGVPAPTLGRNGDYYINYANLLIYGPKASGVWGSSKSLLTGV